MPATLWSQLGPIPVRYEDDPRDDKGEQLSGYWDPAAREIIVRRFANPLVVFQVLGHEWVHSIIDDCGIQLTKEQEEALCNAIGSAIAGDAFSVRR